MQAITIVFVGLWWATWPERTADKYNRLVAAGKHGEAAKLVRCDWPKGVKGDKTSWMRARTRIELRPPSVLDIMFARREIDFHVASKGVVTEDVVRGSYVIKGHLEKDRGVGFASDDEEVIEGERPPPWPESQLFAILEWLMEQRKRRTN